MISAINSYVSFLSFCLYWLRKQHFNLLLDLFWFHFVAWAIVETCQHILCLCCVQVVRLCREHGLYGALIYLFNQGLNDFRTPLEELLSVVQNTNTKDDASSGYELWNILASSRSMKQYDTILHSDFVNTIPTYNMIRYFRLSISCGLWIGQDIVNSEIPGKSVYNEHCCCSLSGYHFYFRI